MRVSLSAALAAAGLVLAGCAAGPGGGPVVGRNVQSAPATVDDARARSFVAVADAIEPVAEAECIRRSPRGVDCDFLIIVDDRPGMPSNAFQTVDPRGRPWLILTVAFIADTRNDDELAFWIAHEAAHHALGHIASGVGMANRGAEVFGTLVAAEPGATATEVEDARAFGAFYGAQVFSKARELEADALGASIALSAGFDPSRGVEMLLRYPDPGDEFLGSHPSHAERLAVVRSVVDGTLVP